MFCLLFNGKNIGFNLSSVCAKLVTVVNNADLSSNPEGAAALDLDVKSDIKKDYEPRFDGVRAKTSSAYRYSAFAAYKTGTNIHDLRDWQKTLGSDTWKYLKVWVRQLKSKTLARTKCCRSYQEAADNNEIWLRILDKPQIYIYNECVFENGVGYLQTTPEYWTSNSRHVSVRIENCGIVLQFIDELLSQLHWNGSNALSLESKIKTAMEDTTVKECASHLANQSTALNLLLTALNW